MKFNHRYEHGGSRPAVIGGPSITQQSFRDSCDVSLIVERCKRTGMPLPDSAKPVYADLTTAPTSLREAMELGIRSKELVESLPVDFKNLVGHDPVKIVEFCSNPDNLPILIKHGLATAPAPAPAPIDDKKE